MCSTSCTPASRPDGYTTGGTSGATRRNLLAFRRRYPAGRNFVVASDVDRPWVQRFGEVTVEFVGLADLLRVLARLPVRADIP